MPAPAVAKILRVGVIQAGKIVEERLLKKREDVTVGHEGRNTIVVPDSNLPASLPLFEYRDHKYFLVFTEQMDGRVRVGESDLDFGALKSQKLAQKRGPVYVYPLGDNAKGKVTVGEVTLLFQFVAPPPEPQARAARHQGLALSGRGSPLLRSAGWLDALPFLRGRVRNLPADSRGARALAGGVAGPVRQGAHPCETTGAGANRAGRRGGRGSQEGGQGGGGQEVQAGRGRRSNRQGGAAAEGGPEGPLEDLGLGGKRGRERLRGRARLGDRGG